MKLVMAIIHDEDSFAVMDLLNENGYFATKLATTGGFLRAGNTTLICGVDDDKVEDVVKIIEIKCESRRQLSTVNSANLPYPIEVEVGGATIFVLNIEEFRKI